MTAAEWALAVVIAALPIAAALIVVLVVLTVRQHSGRGPRHRLYRPEPRRDRLRHLIAPRRHR